MYDKDQNSWIDLPPMRLMSILWSQMTRVTDNTDVMQSQIIFIAGQSGDGWVPGMTALHTLCVCEPNDRVK